MRNPDSLIKILRSPSLYPVLTWFVLAHRLQSVSAFSVLTVGRSYPISSHPDKSPSSQRFLFPGYYYTQYNNFGRQKQDPNMITYDILSEQNATTTNAIIDHFSSSSDFVTFSEAEGAGILQRDEEDASKLQKGIDIAKEKGVIDPNFVPEEYIMVDVLGKTPDQVADEILSNVRKSQGSGGGVVVLCGLSGTGKGTTVAKLREKLMKEDGKKVVCWSNGNVFRSVTLLAATWCEQQADCDGFDASKALTKENLSSFMGMLTFGKFDGKFDTKISGLGVDALVSEIQNTELKVPKVSKNIPTVAEVTQGEVIIFAANAIKQMGEDGIFVLLEGREQTVNYVRTPLRFTLTMSDMTLIGKRRAAQRLAAGTMSVVKDGASAEDISKTLDEQLAKMVKEMNA